MDEIEQRVADILRQYALPEWSFAVDDMLDHAFAVPPRRRGDGFRAQRRFHAFIHEVQLEFGICFALTELEKRLTVEQFIHIVRKRLLSDPVRARRAVDKRLLEAKWNLVGEPIAPGLFFGLPVALLLMLILPKWAWPSVFGLLAIGLTFVFIGSWREFQYFLRLQRRVQDRINQSPDTGKNAEMM